jgi:hypothetical protein
MKPDQGFRFMYRLVRFIFSGTFSVEFALRLLPCPAFCGPNGPNGLKKAKLPILSFGVIYGNSRLWLD